MYRARVCAGNYKAECMYVEGRRGKDSKEEVGEGREGKKGFA